MQFHEKISFLHKVKGWSQGHIEKAQDALRHDVLEHTACFVTIFGQHKQS